MKYLVTLLLLAATLYLFALNNYQLHGSTESRVAGVDAGILANNDWVTPRLNGHPFLEKPPLSNWLGAISIRIFGAEPFAVRLVSVVASVATALLLFAYLLSAGKPAAQAWLAAVLLLTMAQFWSNGRQVGEDALLTCGVSLCLLAFGAAQTRPATWWHWPLFSVGLAIASLSKGVLGLAIPGVAIFAYLLSTSLIEKRFEYLHWLRPAIAALMGLLPLVVWLVFLYQRNGSNAVTELLVANSVGRFQGEFEGNAHVLPFYFYFSRLPELFLPWNVFVFLGLWQLFKTAKQDQQARFFICWLLAPFLLLSLSSGKRMVYALALYPAAAAIAAYYCTGLLQRCEILRSTHKLAAYCYHYHRHIIGLLLALLTSVYLFYAARILPKQDQKESLSVVITELLQRQQDGQTVVLYQPSERLAGAAVFYSGHNLPEVNNTDELQAFLAADSHNVALIDTIPVVGLQILSQVAIGKHVYWFVAK